MKDKHTPGPWRTTAKFEPYHQVPTVYAGIGRKIAECRDSICYTGEDVANARLIAAAPELLEALEKASEWLNDMGCEHDGSGDQKCVVCVVNNAIAKAKGPQ